MTTTDRRVAAVWAVVCMLLLFWLVFAIGANAGLDSKYDDEVAQARKQQHFWRVVAGAEDGHEGGVLNKLARDLYATDPEDIYRFAGDSNRYGGITSELGFDPFNGANCQECGPLDQEVVQDFLTVKRGALQSVLDEIEPSKPDRTPSPPTPLLVLWAALFPIYLGSAYMGRKREEEQKYATMPYEARLVRELDEAMGELYSGSDQYSELLSLKRHLQKAMDERIEYGEDEKNTLRIEELKRNAKDTLDSITAGNRALN